ncbi:SMI1/KNR4 family protein [Streptomyces sp. UNOC14_S4]|uniref:SMI1/KNR4 family protein n=1 Tax=Streptomyces sp. UNOC14_S4 TaxID=2872340 RepID=UPI0027E3B009|nr:SMI1/KNR4 family protein [Streptomyces sp. UNOC14_S4]
MTQGFDLAASLARGVEDRSGAWAFIQGFAAHWTGADLGSDDGWTEAELAAAEKRLGVRLPAALREAYLLFGRRQDLTSNHDVLLGPAELYVDDVKEALVFRHENQGAASWGILLDSLQDDDPAVFIRPDLADKSTGCRSRRIPSVKRRAGSGGSWVRTSFCVTTTVWPFWPLAGRQKTLTAFVI